MRIDVKQLRKQFGESVAVRDVNFTIEEPMMVGVIGRSGAGKSTLLRMINRLAPATSGQIVVDGVDVLALKGRRRRRWQRDCAMIFQQFNLASRLDVLTNVLLGRLHDHSALGSALKLFSREERAQALSALERLGIAEQALKRAEDLSGGQQQRVAIARALMQDPVMILADEPIASLDPLNAKLVMDALRDIRDRDGKTVICNLHTLDTARAYCDRVIGMRAGEVVFDGPPEALTFEKSREIYGAGDAFNEATTSTSLTADAPAAAQRPAPESAPSHGAVAAGQ